MCPDCTVERAAELLETTPAQAAALQRYVMMVCVVNLRRRRDIPHADMESRARTLLRCMSPGMRNKLPEALRYGL